ncbi:MAG TPA: efflux RND transporter periplasmic adaptor subunit [Polyangiaceae bacterium]|nr:efflux RND transporter periplasmic adaptor subunit [Polyangiaceae bacterium]
MDPASVAPPPASVPRPVQQRPSSDSALVLPDAVARPPSKRRRAIFLVLLLLAAGAVAAWTLSMRAGEVHYRVAPVVRRTVVQTVEAQGRLGVASRFEVASPRVGRLVNILVAVGDSVSKDQPLAELDQAPSQASVRGSRAARRAALSRVGEARAALTAARDTRIRTEALASRNVASDADVVNARTAEAKAAATLEAARSDYGVATENVTSAELEMDAGVIRAPASGTVLDAPRWPGMVVGPERGALFVIGTDVSSLRIDAPVAEADIGSIHEGQAAEFTVPAFPGRTFHAQVVDRALEPETTTTGISYRVGLSVANSDRALLPGMSADVRFEVARAEDALAVREAALRFAPENARDAPPRSRVFVTKGGKHPVPVNVVPGVSDAAFTAVTPRGSAALHVGDEVVIGLPPTDDETRRGGPGISLGKR